MNNQATDDEKRDKTHGARREGEKGVIVLGLMDERQLRITENGRRHNRNRQPPNFKLGNNRFSKNNIDQEP